MTAGEEIVDGVSSDEVLEALADIQRRTLLVRLLEHNSRRRSFSAALTTAPLISTIQSFYTTDMPFVEPLNPMSRNFH